MMCRCGRERSKPVIAPIIIRILPLNFMVPKDRYFTIIPRPTNRLVYSNTTCGTRISNRSYRTPATVHICSC
ncbi:hypothetical protein HanIR_Chr11g0503931 [Helianthus annuus]|nr:hypothetical protein HanIR_Chr11g0503931 [Helianthus annuus]